MVRILVALLVGTCFAGCDSGVQRGNFTVSGSRSSSLENDAGWITKLVGTASEMPSDKPQLLIAVVWIGDELHPLGSSGSHGTFVSTHEISTEIGDIAIEWDRRTEVVSFCRKKYNRSEGNVFVVRVTDANISAQQVASVVDSTSAVAIVDALKNALPDDPEVQELTATPGTTE